MRRYTGVGKSNIAAERDFIALKAEVDKLELINWLLFRVI